VIKKGVTMLSVLSQRVINQLDRQWRFERLGAASASLLLRPQDEYDLAQEREHLGAELAAIEPPHAA
jgi:hypothetical protein